VDALGLACCGLWHHSLPFPPFLSLCTFSAMLSRVVTADLLSAPATADPAAALTRMAAVMASWRRSGLGNRGTLQKHMLTVRKELKAQVKSMALLVWMIPFMPVLTWCRGAQTVQEIEVIAPGMLGIDRNARDFANQWKLSKNAMLVISLCLRFPKTAALTIFRVNKQDTRRSRRSLLAEQMLQNVFILADSYPAIINAFSSRTA
jgi:hypothetical protein